MPFIQQTTPPPNKIYTFSLKDFSGGLNNNSDLPEDNQATHIMNMKFTNDTVMEKRPGIVETSELKLDGAITFMDEFQTYKDGNKVIRATNTSFYVDGEKLLDVKGTVRGLTFEGKYFFVDGDSFYVYGKFPQEEGDYVGITGTPVDEYLIMKIVNPPEDYTPLGTEHTEGKTQYNYETKEVWYEPCELEVEDPYKNGNVLPEDPDFLVAYDGRLYVSGMEEDDDNVFISDANKPFYFPTAMPLQPTPNSDRVRGLIVYDNGVIVGRKHDIYMIEGKTNNPELGLPMFELRKINTHTGIASNDAMCVVHNFLFFLGSDGVAYAIGTTKMDERLLHTTIISKQLDLFKDPINKTYEDFEKATCTFFDGEWYVSLGDLVLIYNYRLRAWTLYDSHDATYLTHDGTKLLWGNSQGVVSMYGDDFLDYGKPFECVWQSKWFDMDDANSHKQFREFFIVAHTYDHIDSDVRVKFEIDYVDVKDEVLVHNQIARWGISVFGDRFITRNINASAPFILGRRGRQIRFSLKNGYYPQEPVATRSDLDITPGIYVGYLAYVEDEDSYYLYTENGWEKQRMLDLNQRMKVYQVNGDYEYRGKR